MNIKRKPSPPTLASPSADRSLAPGDGWRIFLTALMVYTVFWNPLLHSSMIWSLIDAAVSYTDTGIWILKHHDLYGSLDTAFVDGKYLLKEPPGLAVVAIPVYLVWKLFGGTADTPAAFQSINAICALLLSASVSSLLTVESARLAAQLGANRKTQLWTAFMVAFGTQNFFFGTTFFKENFTALALVSSFKWAFSPPLRPRLRIWSGFAASLATAITYQAVIIVPILFTALWIRRGLKQAYPFFLGTIPVTLILILYTLFVFGSPFATGYGSDPEIPEAFVIPKVRVLYGMLLGVEGGLLLYTPFLLLGVMGIKKLWHTDSRDEAISIIGIAISYWLLHSSYLSSMAENATCAVGLSHRFLFPIVPFLAVTAGFGLSYCGEKLIFLVSGVSVYFSYLNAQAGFIAKHESVVYALKTYLSGFGMGVFFKEALPKWLGLETLYIYVARPDVHASDVWQQLLTGEKWNLIVNQILFFALNTAILTLVGYAIFKMWQRTPDPEGDRVHPLRNRFR